MNRHLTAFLIGAIMAAAPAARAVELSAEQRRACASFRALPGTNRLSHAEVVVTIFPRGTRRPMRRSADEPEYDQVPFRMTESEVRSLLGQPDAVRRIGRGRRNLRYWCAQDARSAGGEGKAPGPTRLLGFEVLIREGRVVDCERVSGMVPPRDPRSSRHVFADDPFGLPLDTPARLDVAYEDIRAMDLLEYKGRMYVRIECTRKIGHFPMSDQEKPTLYLANRVAHPAGHWCSKGSTILVRAWNGERDPGKERHVQAWRAAIEPDGR